MRITRVAFSFFAVGFVAGTFEQAAGVGDAQRGQHALPVVPSASPAPASLASIVESGAVPVAVTPPASVSGPSARPAVVSASESPPLQGSPLQELAKGAATAPRPLDMGDGIAAEAVAAAFARVAAVDRTVRPEAAEPSPRLRPFFAEPELPPLVVPEPQIAERPKEFIMPMDHGRVTSMFHQGRYHPAIDLAAPLGTPVRATTRKQKVTFAGRRGGYGNLVITRDATGRHHYYGHLQRIVAGIGTLLKQGDLLGLLGSTGHSTGPHVHYEVRKSTGGHFNPAALLFPGLSVQRGYAWNDGGAPMVAAARSTTKTATRVAAQRRVHAARKAQRRTAGRAARRARFAARAPALRYYRTQRASRHGTSYAVRSGQPRPR
jgi:murein DD-endopeptidase MepM/ murein hydrolase activator NlpD